MRARVLLSFPLALLICVTNGFSQDDDPGVRMCTSVFSVDVHDTKNVYSDEYHFSQLQTLLKTASFQSYQDYSSEGANLGVDVPVADIIVGFSGNYKSDSGVFRQELSQFLSTSFDQNVQRSVFAEQMSKINETLLRVFDHCSGKYFDTLKDRIKLSVEIVPDDYKTFSLTIKGYLPQGLGPFKVQSVEPATEVACTYQGKPVSLPKTYPTGATVYACRKPTNKSIHLAVDTNLGVSVPVLLSSPLDKLSVHEASASNAGVAKPVIGYLAKTTSSSSPIQFYPSVVASISPGDGASGYVRVGGGCTVTYYSHGSPHAEVMVASEPTDSGWRCAGADPAGIPNLAAATSTAVYASVSSAKGHRLSCKTKSASSGTVLYPSAQVTMSDLTSQGYVLTSGGCSSSYAGHGSPHAELVVASIPSPDQAGWFCQGSDPANTPNPASITANLVACRIEDDSGSPVNDVKLVSRDFTPNTPSGPQQYPVSIAGVDLGFYLTGGGCEVSYYNHGSPHAEHVVSNAPLGTDSWACLGADPPNIANPATARAHAIGVQITH